uniref:discoidin domain-containing protein n=1 Tax=Dysosmobacter welbionis TaxID=2093857 RepID=UPI003A8D5051
MKLTKQVLAGLLASAMLPVALPAFAAEGRTNIALGKPYTVESDAPNEHSLGTTEQGGKEQLTDGVYGTSEYYSGLWAHFVNAYGRTVTIDLGETMSVDGVAMEFLQNREEGVYCPRTLTVSLSENGTDFETVATIEKPVS